MVQHCNYSPFVICLKTDIKRNYSDTKNELCAKHQSTNLDQSNGSGWFVSGWRWVRSTASRECCLKLSHYRQFIKYISLLVDVICAYTYWNIVTHYDHTNNASEHIINPRSPEIMLIHEVPDWHVWYVHQIIHVNCSESLDIEHRHYTAAM